MTVRKADDKIASFIIVKNNAQNFSEFHPSEEVKARLLELMDHVKSETLTSEEDSELERYLQIEHTMRLAKARFRDKI